MATLADLTSDPHNARRHTPRNVGTIVDSLHAVGTGRSVVIDEDGVILAGNATVEAAAQAGIERVQIVDSDGETLIAVRRTGLTPAQKTRLALADNRAAELADWDIGVLAGLQADSPDLLAGLWREEELADLLAGLADPVVPGGGGDEFDTAPTDGPTRVQPGDVWQMGPHRLVCGDSTDPATVAILMDGKRADCVFTSPPYNSKSELHGTDTFRGSFYLDKSVDAMTAEDYRQFNRRLFFAVGQVLTDSGNVFYNIGYNRNNRDGYIFVIADAIEAGFNLYETIIWKKTGMPNPASRDVLTRDYEFVFLLSRGPSYQTNKPKGEVRSNLWEISNTGAQQDHHKACFPVGLPERALTETTQPGQSVLDPFLGSGTTLIAAHRTGRVCYGVELESRYCDVILRRAEAEGIGPIARVQDA